MRFSFFRAAPAEKIECKAVRIGIPDWRKFAPYAIRQYAADMKNRKCNVDEILDLLIRLAARVQDLEDREMATNATIEERKRDGV